MAKFLASFKEFPQCQKVHSFNLDKVVHQMLSTKLAAVVPDHRRAVQTLPGTIERALLRLYAARPDSSRRLG